MAQYKKERSLILKEIRNKRSATIPEIVESTGLQTNDVFKHVIALTQFGKVRVVGERGQPSIRLRQRIRARVALRFLNYFLIANFAPQTEHLPSAVIFGCSPTSAPQSPHFTIFSPPQAHK